MIQQAKMQGFRYDRLFNGINVGINAYILNHPNGIFYFYENLSAQYILKESLIFDLNNAKIEAIPGKNVDI